MDFFLFFFCFFSLFFFLFLKMNDVFCAGFWLDSCLFVLMDLFFQREVCKVIPSQKSSGWDY